MITFSEPISLSGGSSQEPKLSPCLRWASRDFSPTSIVCGFTFLSDDTWQMMIFSGEAASTFWAKPVKDESEITKIIKIVESLFLCSSSAQGFLSIGCNKNIFVKKKLLQ